MGQKASGFASPALGYEDTAIDLNALLVKRPAATFFFRLESGDMEDLGLPNGAILVVDRAGCPVPNDYVLIAHEGRFLCRLFASHRGRKFFTDGKCDIEPIADDTAVIGVVTASIQVFGKKSREKAGI
jgi:DNA polymerase V